MAISDCASHHISDPLWHMRTSVHVYHAFPGARAYPRARARLCVWRLPLAPLNRQTALPFYHPVPRIPKQMGIRPVNSPP